MGKKIIHITFIISHFFLITSCDDNSSKSCNYVEEYYPLVIKAEIAYLEKDYEKAYNLLEKAFQSCSPRNTAAYYEIKKMAELSARLGYYSKSLEMIKLQIKEGYKVNFDNIDSLFIPVYKSKEGQKLIKDYNNLHQDYLKRIDANLARKIIKMSDSDQKHRLDNNNDSLRIKKLNYIDSINEKELIEIFETYGFPEQHVLKSLGLSMIHVNALLLHTKDSIRIHYFLPKIKQFIKEGKANPNTYAMVYDQYSINNGDPQIYGTSIRLSDRVSSIDSIQMSENREEIGLPSLEDKIKIHNLKLKNYPESSYSKHYRRQSKN